MSFTNRLHSATTQLDKLIQFVGRGRQTFLPHRQCPWCLRLQSGENQRDFRQYNFARQEKQL